MQGTKIQLDPELQPIVGFDLEGTLVSNSRDTDPLVPMPGALEALQAVRHVGAKCILLAKRSATTAQQAGIVVDEVHNWVYDQLWRVRKLTRLGVFAYVSGSPNRIKALRHTGIRTVGVVSERHSATQLRRAGAEVTLEHLEDFPAWVKWSNLEFATMADSQETIKDSQFYSEHVGKAMNTSEAAAFIGCCTDTIDRWVKRGTLHATMVKGRRFFDSWELHLINKALGWLQTSQVAEELNLSRRRVNNLITQGELRSVRLSGEHYIEPLQFAAYKASREEALRETKQNTYFSRWAARFALGVGSAVIAHLEAVGRLKYTDKKGFHRSEIEKLQREQKTLRPEFEGWLEIKPRTKMYGPKYTGKLLGISLIYANELASRGVLPFRTSSLAQLIDRDFPSDYIDALARFAASTPGKSFLEKALAFREMRKQEAQAARADHPS